MSHTCGVSLTHFCTVPPESRRMATAAPTPPIVAGFVTAKVAPESASIQVPST